MQTAMEKKRKSNVIIQSHVNKIILENEFIN